MSRAIKNAKTPRLWKVTDAKGRAQNGGTFQYSLPRWSRTKGWIAGEWTPRIAPVDPCNAGYHVCRDEDVVHWLGGFRSRIWAVETDGPLVIEENKVVCERIRLTCPTPWDEVSARLFAVECASDCLSIYESLVPNDARVSDALEVAHRSALGQATEEERSAAWSAARSAAESAAESAARSAAESAAWSAAWSAARSAAESAAWSAARSAAESAARSAAESAARSRQTERLLWWMGAR